MLLVSATVTGAFATLPSGDGEACVMEESTALSRAYGYFGDDPTISIFPNPVKSYATISFTYENVDRICILNIVGREIKTIVPEAGKNEIKVSLVDLQPGWYFLAAYSQGSTLITKKFLKEE